jgi:hypothetical protein
MSGDSIERQTPRKQELGLIEGGSLCKHFGHSPPAFGGRLLGRTATIVQTPFHVVDRTRSVCVDPRRAIFRAPDARKAVPPARWTQARVKDSREIEYRAETVMQHRKLGIVRKARAFRLPYSDGCRYDSNRNRCSIHSTQRRENRTCSSLNANDPRLNRNLVDADEPGKKFRPLTVRQSLIVWPLSSPVRLCRQIYCVPCAMLHGFAEVGRCMVATLWSHS